LPRIGVGAFQSAEHLPGGKGGRPRGEESLHQRIQADALFLGDFYELRVEGLGNAHVELAAELIPIFFQRDLGKCLLRLFHQFEKYRDYDVEVSDGFLWGQAVADDAPHKRWKQRLEAAALVLRKW